MAGSQDMFDAIVMADERFHGEGYQEGYEEGNSLGIIEGRQYGTLHGAKIGSEIDGCGLEEVAGATVFVQTDRACCRASPPHLRALHRHCDFYGWKVSAPPCRAGLSAPLFQQHLLTSCLCVTLQ
ncbi:protein LTO1 homolog isoform X3 [Ailuropoda melanoleuca]|uniref:protein LTO1 homolog isoform X3 n=1 Tax=Ailuropoda melanoleuca TaxID=9646 RepID=UPI0014940B5B|nr:protein LTO1 homolog isoform X3 [Ailuropoda melanoleuca]